MKHQFKAWSIKGEDGSHRLVRGSDDQWELYPFKHHTLVAIIENSLAGCKPIPVLVTVEEIPT